MPFEREVAKVNELLGREYGRTPDGRPIYAWVWSEALMHPRRKMRDDGSPIYDYYANELTGLIEPRPIYELVRKGGTEHLFKQWVLCKWHPPVSEDQWRAAFGTWLEWPKSGEYWAIAGKAGTGPVALPRDDDHPPSEAVTERVIQLMNAESRASTKNKMDKISADIARAEAAQLATIKTVVKDVSPAFGGIPGRKEHWSQGGIGENLALTTKENHVGTSASS